MSYSVTLQGHKDVEDVEAFEKDVIDKVTAFAHSLPGFAGGTVNTSTQAQAVLQASDSAETPEAETDDGAEDKPDVPEQGNPTDAQPDVPEQGNPTDAQPGDSADLSSASTAELQAEIARRSAQ